LRLLFAAAVGARKAELDPITVRVITTVDCVLAACWDDSAVGTGLTGAGVWVGVNVSVGVGDAAAVGESVVCTTWGGGEVSGGGSSVVVVVSDGSGDGSGEVVLEDEGSGSGSSVGEGEADDGGESEVEDGGGGSLEVVLLVGSTLEVVDVGGSEDVGATR
jgi:hypothetical protein